MQLNGTTKSLVANHLAESIAGTKPLKEDCKMQLTLELTHEKSCRILDTLVLEALRGVNIKELEIFLPKTSDVFLSNDVKTACSVLADGIIVGLYEYLAPMKASAVSLTLWSLPPPPFP